MVTDSDTVVSGSRDGKRPLKIFIIHIHHLQHPIEVSYEYVNKTIPKLLFSRKTDAKTGPYTSTPDPVENSKTSPEQGSSPLHRNYDIVLNIGLAPGRTFYALETQAHRDGYTSRDVYGHTPAHGSIETINSSDRFNDRIQEPPAVDEQTRPQHQPINSAPSPPVLIPTFDMQTLFRHWTRTVRKGHLSSHSYSRGNDVDNTDPNDKITLDLSRDAGRYLCEYIFYTSLSQYWKYDRSRRGRNTKDPDSSSEDKTREEDEKNASQEMEPRRRGKEEGKRKDKMRENRPCFFLHVPSGNESDDVARGVRVVLGLLEAICCTMSAGAGSRDDKDDEDDGD